MGAARKLSLISESQPRPTVAAAVAPFVSAIIYSIVGTTVFQKPTSYTHKHTHMENIYVYSAGASRDTVRNL